MNKAVSICRTVNPYREVHAKWITGYGRAVGRLPVHEQKVWMELIGMVGGPVRVPCDADERGSAARRCARISRRAACSPRPARAQSPNRCVRPSDAKSANAPVQRAAGLGRLPPSAKWMNGYHC